MLQPVRVFRSKYFARLKLAALCGAIVFVPCVSRAATTTGQITLACPAPNGVAGAAYNSSLTANGGVPPYTFSITNGAPPGGLSLNPSTGAITGVPLGPETATFTGQVVDSLIPGAGGSPDSTSLSCTITVAPAPAEEGPVLTGMASQVSGSSATLILTEDLTTDNLLEWTSHDSVFGSLGTGGFVPADSYTYTPENGPTRDLVSFQIRVGNAILQGIVTITSTAVTGVVNVVQTGVQTVQYTLNQNRVIQITATIQPTPCQTVRAAGQTRPAAEMFQSTQATQNFNTPTTLVMLQASAATVPLTATKSMPNGNILYFIQRAPDDNPAIGGANALPTLTPNGPDAANLGTNQTGSFSIGAYVDVNNNGKRDFFEPITYLNYVLAGLLSDAAINNSKPVVDSVQVNQTITIARNPNNAVTWTRMLVNSGNFNIGTPNQNAIYLNATVDLVGGGPDGLRGLNSIFGGWVNNELPEGVQGFYANNHVTSSVFASNRPANRIFLPGGVIPATVNPPLLDTGRNPAGQGADTATLTRSRIRSRTNLARGSRLAVDAVDSPGDSFARFDPGFIGSALQAADFALTFNAYLALWTNATAVIGATGDAADRLYSVGEIAPWNQRASWGISPTGVATAAGVPAVASNGRSVQQNVLLQATATRMEVCTPTALNLLATNARN